MAKGRGDVRATPKRKTAYNCSTQEDAILSMFGLLNAGVSQEELQPSCLKYNPVVAFFNCNGRGQLGHLDTCQGSSPLHHRCCLREMSVAGQSGRAGEGKRCPAGCFQAAEGCPLPSSRNQSRVRRRIARKQVNNCPVVLIRPRAASWILLLGTGTDVRGNTSTN